MFRLVGSILMVLAILAGYVLTNRGDSTGEAAAPVAPAGAEPSKNFNL